MTKTFLHVGWGPNRKYRTTYGFANSRVRHQMTQVVVLYRVKGPKNEGNGFNCRTRENCVVRRSYKYCFDNLATNNNLDVLISEDFLCAYDRAIVKVGSDLKIPLRVHQTIWCAQYALGIGGDFVEIGTGEGFTFSAIMEYLTKNSLLNVKNKKVYLFDSFLPVKSDFATRNQLVKSAVSMPTAYSDDSNSVRLNFSEWDNVHIIEGELPNSAEDFVKTVPKISFLHIDLIHFKPEISTLESFGLIYHMELLLFLTIMRIPVDNRKSLRKRNSFQVTGCQFLH
jgi:hypothetical protein